MILKIVMKVTTNICHVLCKKETSAQCLPSKCSLSRWDHTWIRFSDIVSHFEHFCLLSWYLWSLCCWSIQRWPPSSSKSQCVDYVHIAICFQKVTKSHIMIVAKVHRLWSCFFSLKQTSWYISCLTIIVYFALYMLGTNLDFSLKKNAMNSETSFSVHLWPHSLPSHVL